MFARFAWNQWNWRDSEFNRQFRFPANELTELADEQLEDVPNKYQELIHSFLNSMPKDDQELFIKEVTKMHLYGMTYREIKENTGLGLDTIHKTIKKFKHDLYFYSGGDCSELAKLPVAEH
jgi:DNA-directed RNA polymerase specialized sigma24 family protein